jgi:thiol-disulfide isomerase/thioredoxin
MFSVDEVYESGRKFVSKNMYSLSVLIGLFLIYALVTTEEGISNMGAAYPGVFEGGKPTNSVKSDGKIIPDPKPLKQKPTATMTKESEYLAHNRVDNDKFMEKYSLLSPGMVPSNNYRQNSQLLSERGSGGDITGIIEGSMFQALGDIDSETSMKKSGASSPSSKKITLKLIYAPWCGWSKKALPEFDKIMNELNNTSKNGVTIIIEKHNSDENKEIVKKYNIRGFPHYILEISEGDTVTKTVKVQDRDYAGLKKVIMNNL